MRVLVGEYRDFEQRLEELGGEQFMPKLRVGRLDELVLPGGCPS